MDRRKWDVTIEIYHSKDGVYGYAIPAFGVREHRFASNIEAETQGRAAAQWLMDYCRKCIQRELEPAWTRGVAVLSALPFGYGAALLFAGYALGLNRGSVFWFGLLWAASVGLPWVIWLLARWRERPSKGSPPK